MAPTASTAYRTKSMPAATAMAVRYPTTRYPAGRESQLEDSRRDPGRSRRVGRDSGTEESTAESGRSGGAVGDVGAPQQRAVRANEAVTADPDRLLDETAGVDLRGLEVHVSPDDRVVPDVNALQIAEA